MRRDSRRAERAAALTSESELQTATESNSTTTNETTRTEASTTSSGGREKAKCHLCGFFFERAGLKGRKRCYCGKYVHPDCFKGDGESCQMFK